MSKRLVSKVTKVIILSQKAALFGSVKIVKSESLRTSCVGIAGYVDDVDLECYGCSANPYSIITCLVNVV